MFVDTRASHSLANAFNLGKIGLILEVSLVIIIINIIFLVYFQPSKNVPSRARRILLKQVSH
jgi:hypothetical protein